MALPLPNAPEGVAKLTLTVNLDGETPVTKFIPAAKVAKIQRFINDLNGMTPTGVSFGTVMEWLLYTLKHTQFRELDGRYPDPPTEQEVQLAAQIQTLQSQLATSLQTRAKWLED